jgi:hypothetical protein
MYGCWLRDLPALTASLPYSAHGINPDVKSLAVELKWP